MAVEIPRYVRYDFLITLVGFGLMMFYVYYAHIKPTASLEGILNLSVIISIFLIPYGLGQMYNNYVLEVETTTLETFVKKKEYIKKLKTEKLIEIDEEASLNYFLREEIRDLIDKKIEKKEEKKSNT